MFYNYKFSVNIVKFPFLLLFLNNISFDIVRGDVADVYNHTNGGDWNETDYRFLVIGGYRPTTQSLNKYVVSLRTFREVLYFGDNHFCGGTIIAKKIILTAAHCLVEQKGASIIPRRANDLLIVAGTPNRLQQTSKTQILRAEYIRLHPDFSELKFDDVALIFLLDEIKEDGETAKRMSLPKQPVPTYTMCTLIGWGTLFHKGPLPDEIIYADFRLYTWMDCQVVFAKSRNGMICATDEKDKVKSGCSGDSGGPLIFNHTIVGIASFAFPCGISGPTFFVDVFHYKEWIEENMIIGSQERSVMQESGAITININAFIQFVFTFIILNLL